MKSKITRRNFLGTAAAGAAAFSVIPGYTIASSVETVKIRLGFIGVGIQSHGLLKSLNMNLIHHQNMLSLVCR